MLNSLRYKRAGEQEPGDTTVSPTTTPSGDGIISPPKPYTPKPEQNNKSTDTIAAITVALLAVVLVFSMLLICRAIKKRRQAMRGRQLNAVPTVATGIMGTGTAAYGNVHVEGRITWESIDNRQGNNHI